MYIGKICEITGLWDLQFSHLVSEHLTPRRPPKSKMSFFQLSRPSFIHNREELRAELFTKKRLTERNEKKRISMIMFDDDGDALEVYV